MAKNDYFIVAYRILARLYDFFKAGERAEMEAFSPDALGISNGYWVNVMESLYNEGYITGIYFSVSLGGITDAKIFNLKITQRGIEFLENNSCIAKAKKLLKEVKETVPGL